VRRAVVAVLLTVLAVSSGVAEASSTKSKATARFPSVSFVVTCGFSHRASDDPLVHPGHKGMSHVHDFFANTTTSASSTPATLAKGSTTCNESGDRAAYWLPALEAGAWAKTLRAYYSAGPVDPGLIVPYPAGLGIIGRSSSGAVDFSCERGVDEPGWTSRPPTCVGPTSVRITFPQCWNGRGLTPSDVSAPVGRSCPKGFDRALPLLRLVAQTESRTTSMATSAGSFDRMHADFWNAWDPKILGQLVAVCIRGERTSNREIKQCRTAGTGPRAVGGPETESNF
jgi:Domain of unknown function (DUF1996)